MKLELEYKKFEKVLIRDPNIKIMTHVRVRFVFVSIDFNNNATIDKIAVPSSYQNQSLQSLKYLYKRRLYPPIIVQFHERLTVTQLKSRILV